jgi:hypothetical protein
MFGILIELQAAKARQQATINERRVFKATPACVSGPQT